MGLGRVCHFVLVVHPCLVDNSLSFPPFPWGLVFGGTPAVLRLAMLARGLVALASLFSFSFSVVHHVPFQAPRLPCGDGVCAVPTLHTPSILGLWILCSGRYPVSVLDFVDLVRSLVFVPLVVSCRQASFSCQSGEDPKISRA